MRFLAEAAIALCAAAILQGCTETKGPETTTTTLTTTWFCSDEHVPWPSEGKGVDCQPLAQAMADSQAFLKSNMPPWDTINLESLEEGILAPTLTLSFKVREMYPWAEAVPRDIWENFVLPYASVNEPRVDWRQLFFKKLGPLVYNSTFQADNISQVASVLNTHLWSVLRPEGSIEFKVGQTPLIYDPMSVITYGYASCTGVSVTLVDALRSVGVPARIVGTPAWHGNFSDGNHNWVEIWLGPGQGLHGEPWSFIEAVPAGPGEKLDNPCDKWFCNPSHFDNRTQVFAPQYERQSNQTFYPMAWDMGNENIPGVNRTLYYNALCQPCGKTITAGVTVQT